MSDEMLREILANTKRIATVGFSRRPIKPSHYVPRYLIEHGYEVVPINPHADEIAGQKAYEDLAAVPGDIDMVQLFRPSDKVAPYVDQAIEIGAKYIWMQQGIADEASAQKAREAGLQVVMDRCAMVEHRRLM